MSRNTMEDILKTMKDPSCVRNISVIAHVDHGKSTLTDSLITEAGLMSSKHTGNQKTGRKTDTMDQEKLRGITIQSTAVSLYYEVIEETIEELDNKIQVDNNNSNNKNKKSTNNNNNNNNNELESKEEMKISENIISKNSNKILVNLIDSPGHVDFNSEVTAALRVTDGALVVIDCLEGVCVQTETVLIQALNEKIKPILFLNKLDRIFLETKPSHEDAYNILKESIESVDVICQTYKNNNNEFNISLRPEIGNVGFGSGLHAWGFTLKTFASMYSMKFGIKTKKLMKLLFGNYYYNKKTGKFKQISNNNDNKNNIRTFIMFILHPIKLLCDSIMNSKKEIYEPIIKSLKLNFNKLELSSIKKPKDYLKLVLRKWLPLGQCLVGMISEFLPSPLESQKYRYNLLYNGDLNSKEALDIKNCNNNGNMSMYISKLVPYGNSGRFVAFGRVFSGTLKPGDSVYILDNDNDDNNNNNDRKIINKKISNLLLMVADKTQSLSTCYAGNLCSIVGIDDYISKACTLSNNKLFNPFKSMNFSVSPVVKYSIKCKKAKDLPKLLDGLKKLSKMDCILNIETSKNGENIISGAGELHLEVNIERLKSEILNNKIEIELGEPIVKICESISSSTICNIKTDKKELNLIVGKSRNNLNRLYMNAEPLSNNFINDIENNKININLLNKNLKLFSKQLSNNNNNNYNLEKNDILNIWTFGCQPDSLCNILVNKTKGETYINEIKGSTINSFMNYTSKGVLCNENVRGIKYNLKYCKIHSDKVHRNPDEISFALRKCMYGSQLSSNPILLQPMYNISIQTNLKNENNVIKSLQIKGGSYNETIYKSRGDLIIIKGYLPVLNSFGFTGFIRKETSGRAYPQMTFSHWTPIKGNPLQENTQSYKIVQKIRKRKSLDPTLPKISNFCDRV